MKAEIISQTVYEGGLAFVHGCDYQIQRILVPEANNLVITTQENNLYVWDNFKKGEDCQTVKEIDIPDELVEKAISFMKDRNSLLEQFGKFTEDEEDKE